MVNISVPPLMFTCICCAIMPRCTNTIANYGRIAQSLICIMYILVAYVRACAWRCSCRGCENPLRAHAATCPQGYILNAFQHIPTVIAQPPAFSIPHEEDDDRREMKHARVRTDVRTELDHAGRGVQRYRSYSTAVFTHAYVDASTYYDIQESSYYR